MTPALLCVVLRLAVPLTLGQAEFIANDPCFRYGARVRLSPAACNYLRTETFPEPHPRARCVKKRGKYVCERKRRR